MTTTTRTREGLVETSPSSDPRAGTPPTREGGRPGLAPGRALGVGVVGLWLSVIVLLPLAALTVHSLDEGLAGFWDAVTADRKSTRLNSSHEVPSRMPSSA